MATQRTTNTHLLARDGSSSHPGHGHLAPAWGLSSCAWLPACRLPCAWPVFPWRVVVFVSRPLSSWLPRLLCAPAAAAHGGSPLWCPRGLALVSLCSLHLPSRAFSAPFSGAPCPRPASCLVVMSCVSLQLSSRPQPRPPRLPALQRLRPTPMMTGTLSSMHMASPRLPVALRPPLPSRPTPLELVGAPATSAAAVCARPPSALCGGRSDVLSPVLCALSAGVASSCGFVCFSVASFSLATRG